MHALDIQYTVFPNVKAETADRKSDTWGGLVQMLRTPGEFAAKEWCPLLSGCAFGHVRSPKGSLRHSANVEAVFFIEGDYDEERVTAETVQALLTAAGVAAVIYTSASHTTDKPRWRVLAPLSKPYPARERERLVALLNGALGGILGRESFNLSQSYYFGKVKGREYKCLEVLGTPIDQHDLFIDELRPSDSNGHALTQGDDLPETISDESMADLQAAVRALRPTRADNYPDWVNVLQNIKHAEFCGRPEAEPLAREFSARSPKFNEANFHRKWECGLHPSRGHFRKLFDLAQALAAGIRSGFRLRGLRIGRRSRRLFRLGGARLGSARTQPGGVFVQVAVEFLDLEALHRAISLFLLSRPERGLHAAGVEASGGRPVNTAGGRIART